MILLHIFLHFLSNQTIMPLTKNCKSQKINTFCLLQSKQRREKTNQRSKINASPPIQIENRNSYTPKFRFKKLV